MNLNGCYEKYGKSVLENTGIPLKILRCVQPTYCHLPEAENLPSQHWNSNVSIFIFKLWEIGTTSESSENRGHFLWCIPMMTRSSMIYSYDDP